jgi:hypothetical protein
VSGVSSISSGRRGEERRKTEITGRERKKDRKKVEGRVEIRNKAQKLLQNDQLL